jgi:hypothetical protein
MTGSERSTLANLGLLRDGKKRTSQDGHRREGHRVGPQGGARARRTETHYLAELITSDWPSRVSRAAGRAPLVGDALPAVSGSVFLMLRPVFRALLTSFQT